MAPSGLGGRWRPRGGVTPFKLHPDRDHCGVDHHGGDGDDGGVDDHGGDGDDVDGDVDHGGVGHHGDDGDGGPPLVVGMVMLIIMMVIKAMLMITPRRRLLSLGSMSSPRSKRAVPE